MNSKASQIIASYSIRMALNLKLGTEIYIKKNQSMGHTLVPNSFLTHMWFVVFSFQSSGPYLETC